MEKEELLVELEAIHESVQSHWRSMKYDGEEEAFKRVQEELDKLILTVQQREMDISHAK